MKKIVLQQSEDGAWTATFIAKGGFTIRDYKAAERVLNMGYQQQRRKQLIQRRLKRCQTTTK